MRGLCHQTSCVGVLISEVVTEVATARDRTWVRKLPSSQSDLLILEDPFRIPVPARQV